MPDSKLADQLRLVEAVTLALGREVRQPVQRQPGSRALPSLAFDSLDRAPTVRDALFDALLQMIGAVLEGDLALGGLAFGLTYSRPEPTIEAVSGAPAIKSATLTVTVDYETEAPLS